MAILDELTEGVGRIARSQWSVTDGRVVPETESVGLGNDGVELDATLFYADLADSTEIAAHSERIAAEVYKAFLLCGTKLIRLQGGHVRSFDGDRVMGVFIGGSKNTNAVTTALKLKYVFDTIIVPQFKMYDVFNNGTLTLQFCSGIDTGSVLVARGGVRNNNDLVWVGKAPNVAAKLSTLRRAPYNTYITKAVHSVIDPDLKAPNGVDIWEERVWTALPAGKHDLYRTNRRIKP